MERCMSTSIINNSSGKCLVRQLGVNILVRSRKIEGSSSYLEGCNTKFPNV